MFAHVAQEHLTTQISLIHLIGRCGDIDQKVGAPLDLVADRIGVIQRFRPEILVVPAVLADGNSEVAPAEGDKHCFTRPLEVAVLVEHIVGGQQSLVNHSLNFPIAEKGRGVVQGLSLRPVAIHESDCSFSALPANWLSFGINPRKSTA